MKLASFFVSICLQVSGQSPNTGRTRDFIPRHIVGVEYPWFARLGVAEGKVELSATVAPDGSLTGIRVISGAAPLVGAAKQSFSKWVFQPCTARVDECVIATEFLFVLQKELCDSGSYCPSQFEADLPSKVVITAKRIKAIVN